MDDPTGIVTRQNIIREHIERGFRDHAVRDAVRILAPHVRVDTLGYAELLQALQEAITKESQREARTGGADGQDIVQAGHDSPQSTGEGG